MLLCWVLCLNDVSLCEIESLAGREQKMRKVRNIDMLVGTVYSHVHQVIFDDKLRLKQAFYTPDLFLITLTPGSLLPISFEELSNLFVVLQDHLLSAICYQLFSNEN